MKKLILLPAILIATLSFALEKTALNNADPRMNLSSLSGGDKKNIVKLNLTSISMGSINLQYERCLARQFSVALGVSLMPSRHLPSFAIAEDPSGALGLITLSGFSFTPEFRLYVSAKGSPHGFYLAPYLRYAKYSLKIPGQEYTYHDNTLNMDVTDEFTVGGSYGGFGGGLMIGSQWIIGKLITIDWFILGGHYGSGKIALTGELNSGLPPEAKEEIKNQMSEIEVPWSSNKPVTTFSGNEMQVSLKTPFIGLRMFGLNVGVAF